MLKLAEEQTLGTRLEGGPCFDGWNPGPVNQVGSGSCHPRSDRLGGSRAGRILQNVSQLWLRLCFWKPAGGLQRDVGASFKGMPGCHFCALAHIRIEHTTSICMCKQLQTNLMLQKDLNDPSSGLKIITHTNPTSLHMCSADAFGSFS